MRFVTPRAGVLRRLTALVGLLLGVAGCAGSTPLGRAGIEIEPGDGWTRVDASKVVVPGSTIAAWSGPDDSSLVALSSLPIPNPNAEALAKETAIRMENLPGITIIGSSVQTYGGLKASRVEVIGQGTGDALAPSGIGKPVSPDGKPLIPTRRLSISFPRGKDTLTLLWHYPDSARATVEPRIESILRTVKVTDTAIASSSYSY